MTTSEIAFLAFGLILGAALGAALVQIARAHPAPRGQVRITITPNAIPVRRSHTLAVPYDTAHPGIIHGSPDTTALDQAAAAARAGGSGTGPLLPADSRTIRTRVPSPAVGLPATTVAVPIAMASAAVGREAWPDIPSPRAAVAIGQLATDRATPAPSL